MKVGVMITDGGPHPPEKWAEVTADQIIQISETAPEARLIEARTFRERIVAVLTPHHANVQEHERGHIRGAHGQAHVATALEPESYIDEAVDDVIAAAKGLSFEAHFARPETLEYLRNVIGSHFATAQHIERSWATDETDVAHAHRDAHDLPHPGA